ncbi:MAG: hypothetical protein ACI97X_001363, partial [Oceanospirillaceae bacterium]
SFWAKALSVKLTPNTTATRYFTNLMIWFD